MSSEERCPLCGSLERDIRCCTYNENGVPCIWLDKVADVTHEETECPDPWHSPAPVDAEPWQHIPSPSETWLAKAPAPAEGAGQFHASWMRANIRRLVEKNPSEIEIEFAEAYAASLREQLAQAQRESAHFEELMHAAVEDYGNARRELEEARASNNELHIKAEELSTNLGAARIRLTGIQGERDDAVSWIRVVGEEMVLAGFAAGDRTVQLANIRALLARSTGTKERGESKEQS